MINIYTPINLDKARNFRYNMKALSLIEKKFKKNLSAIDFENLTIEETMTIIWAGLVHEDRELTTDKVMDIIDTSGIRFDAIVKAMSEAISDSFGASEGEENPNQAVAE